MSEGLIPFWEIDPYDDESGYTADQLDAAEFLHAMDNEGGLSSLLYYGVHAFPEDLRGLAQRTYLALENMEQAVRDWAAKKGVEA